MSDQNFTKVNQKIGYPVLEESEEKIPEGVEVSVPNNENIIVVSSLPREQSFYESVLYSSKFLKILSILDSMACILFFLSGMSFLIFLLAFPVVGYCGAKYYHRSLMAAYKLYLVIIITTRVVLIGVVGTLKYGLIQGVIVLIELGIFLFAIRFSKQLNLLSKLERIELRIRGNQYIVPEADVSQIENF